MNDERETPTTYETPADELRAALKHCAQNIHDDLKTRDNDLAVYDSYANLVTALSEAYDREEAAMRSSNWRCANCRRGT